jgi:C4-dicarboxylate-binding protein DctP
MKKIMLISFIVTALLFTSCGGSPPDDASGDTPSDSGDSGETPVTLVFGASVPPTHCYALAKDWMKEYLTEIGSSVTLDDKFGGELGSEREMGESTILGTLDMCLISDMSTAPFIPKVVFANFPGMYEDFDDVIATYRDGWVGEEVKKVMAEKGLKVLGIIDNDFRWMTNSKHPIITPEDVAGMKLRVPEVEYLVDFFNEMNVLSTPVTIGELATALQQGVVDGQDNGITVIEPFGLYEFNKYMTQTRHSYSAAVILINPDVYASLSPQQQADIDAAAAYAVEKEWEYTLGWRDDTIKRLEAEEGCEIIEPSQEMTDYIAQVGQKMVQSEKYRALFGDELIAKMYADK